MNTHEYLTEDGHVLLSLCSSYALPADHAAGNGPAPFKLSEWNDLSRKLAASTLSRPAGLAGKSAQELTEALPIAAPDAERIVRLLDRGGRMAMELDGLFSRGMWVVTRVDPHYPARLRETLKHQAPTVLFGAGPIEALRRSGVAVVGSRTIDEAGTAFAQETGRKCAAAKAPVVSGGARGSDRLAMQAALEASGTAIGVMADSLERTVRLPDVREFLLEARLVLVTPYAPTAGFSVGAAMGRNKVIYGMAEYAVVVSSDFQTGGTWAGAVEALKARWCPVFVRDGESVPNGNKELLKLGAVPLPASELERLSDLCLWMSEHAGVITTPAVEKDLFGFALREQAK